MTKYQISQRIAELYNVSEFDYVFVLDNVHQMFELAVEHGIAFDPENNEASTAYIKVKGHIKHAIDAIHADHATKLEATLWAIGLALIALKESIKQ
jgi:hypothetical protein